MSQKEIGIVFTSVKAYWKLYKVVILFTRLAINYDMKFTIFISVIGRFATS